MIRVARYVIAAGLIATGAAGFALVVASVVASNVMARWLRP